MEATNNERKILTELRTRLTRFCNCRERAYSEMRKKGYEVPGYSAKLAAILFIRIHLQASENWPLAPHVRMVAHTLRQHITVLLPFEFHEVDRQRSYRKHVLDLLRFCDERMERRQISLFNNKPPSSMIKQLWMRPGARVLANGRPGEIITISYLTTPDVVTQRPVEQLNFVHVCMDGTDEVECFRPHVIQRDRIRREVSHA